MTIESIGIEKVGCKRREQGKKKKTCLDGKPLKTDSETITAEIGDGAEVR